ncbi:MAG: NAD-dependent epimerase/dehydratase family protein [Candidatus Absconditabacterales bacterium]
MTETILITGTSGFIGFHTAKKLLEDGVKIIGFDNENDYYDVNLKIARRTILEQFPNFKFYKGSLENLEDLKKVFEENKIDKVLNLAAQAGVRYSLINPFAYVQSNLVGFHNIIELSKQYKIKNFVYASSSSVYGNNTKQPFSVDDPVDHPISIYAATKKADELIAHSYSHLFGLPTIGLRFFTVYGPRGRPDMAMLIFASKMLKGEAIDVFNNGKMKRDFTYIDDIVSGIIKALELETKYEIFNLGSDHPVDLEYIISLIEKNLGKKAIKNYLPLQPGDVPETSADIQHTTEVLGWKPEFKVEKGIENFVNRYKSFYTVEK